MTLKIVLYIREMGHNVKFNFFEFIVIFLEILAMTLNSVTFTKAFPNFVLYEPRNLVQNLKTLLHLDLEGRSVKLIKYV